MHGSSLLVTIPPPPQQAFAIFSFSEVYSPPQGQFSTPKLLIDLIYNFFNIFFIRTKAKQHIFTTFMNVFLSLLREG